MDQRSIDFAKTASVDLMTLNNTVVNMRQVVRRARVRVINKLCRHITALKKKKGTDEQKAKNIRKAERYVDEIDSMKKLKEDKVSKYALANTASFSEVSKTCLLPGPRAMARLADHPLLKKVITEFREKHSDWRELAAYLLVKQTGRRFKTKKQKQQKRAKCVENIDASKTMTKVYIQERFGQEGLTKAEERFKRKRRLIKPDSSSGGEDSGGQKSELVAVSADVGDNSDGHNVSESFKQNSREPLLQQKDDSNGDISSEENDDGDGDVSSEENKEEVEVSADMEVGRDSREQESEIDEVEEINNDESDEDEDVESDKKEESEDDEDAKYMQNSQSGVTIKQNSKSTKEGSIQENKNEHSVPKRAKVVSEKPVSLSDDTTESSGSKAESSGGKIKSQRQKKSECVVKQLNLGSDNDDSDSDSEAASSSNTEENSEESEEDEEVESADSDISDENNHQDKLKGKKRKTSQVPEFLTKVSQTRISDPFFAGSDDDDTNVTLDDSHNFGFNSDDNEDEINDDEEGGNSKAKSRFYQPHWRSRDNLSRGQASYGVKGHRGGGFRTQNDSGKFDRQAGVRSFSGNNRNLASNRGSRFQSSDRQRWGHQNENNQGDKSRNQKDKLGPKKVSTQQTSQTVQKGLGTTQLPEKLHPSWEASKKRKAEQSSLKAFSGSRITFDDD